jgi:hypothetical protein
MVRPTLADLTKFQMPGVALTITTSQVFPAEDAAKGIPTHATDAKLFSSFCQANGIIDPRTGAEGKHYAVGFEVAMPDNSSFCSSMPHTWCRP